MLHRSLSYTAVVSLCVICVLLFPSLVTADYKQSCGSVTVTACSPTRWYFYSVRLRDTLTTRNALGINLVSGPGGSTVNPSPGHVLYTGGICQPTDTSSPDQCNEYGQAGRACGPSFGGFTGGCSRESSNVFVTTGVAGTLDWKIGVYHPEVITDGATAENCTTSTCDFKLSVYLTHATGSTATCEIIQSNGTDPTSKAITNPCPPAGTSFASAPSVVPASLTIVVLTILSTIVLFVV